MHKITQQKKISFKDKISFNFKFYYHIFFTINVLVFVLYSGLYVDQFAKPKFESTARFHQQICEKDKKENSKKICTLEKYNHPLENWSLLWFSIIGIILIGTVSNNKD